MASHGSRVTNPITASANAGTGDLFELVKVAASATRPITVARSTLGCGLTNMTNPTNATTVTKYCKFLLARNLRITAKTKTTSNVTLVPETAIK